jgi:hypothetical protein
VATVQHNFLKISGHRRGSTKARDYRDYVTTAVQPGGINLRDVGTRARELFGSVVSIRLKWMKMSGIL